MLKRNVLNFTVSKVNCLNDHLVFPFLKDSQNPSKDVSDFENKLLNQKICSVNRHGKYFWLRFLDENVLLMHFGMTGMIKLKNIDSHLTFMENGGDKKILNQIKNEVKLEAKEDEMKQLDIKLEDSRSKLNVIEQKVDVVSKTENEQNHDNLLFKTEDAEGEEMSQELTWPPKFGKLSMTLTKGDQIVELVFVDPRRLARIRYLSGPEYRTNQEMFNQSPLNVLGPDYSKPLNVPKVLPNYGDIDPIQHGKPILNIEQFQKLILTKKKPIKSLLLDQGYFAGVGNWVADEIIYQARLFPNDIISQKLPLQDEIHPIIQKLYDKLIYVCLEAVKVEGDVTKFPSDWLMIFRWGKARKKGPKQTTNDGYEVDHITVGGRTSCYVPELQKPLKNLKIDPVKQENDEILPKKVQKILQKRTKKQQSNQKNTKRQKK